MEEGDKTTQTICPSTLVQNTHGKISERENMHGVLVFSVSGHGAFGRKTEMGRY